MSVKAQNKLWFKVYKKIISIIYRKPKFVYLDKEITEPSIILSNHIFLMTLDFGEWQK